MHRLVLDPDTGDRIFRAPEGARLILIRHGETLWNRTHRWQGHTDIPLSDLGREQATALAARLIEEPIDAVYASDLRRAVETATLICRGRDLDLNLNANLREVCLGPFEGLTTDEIRESLPEAFQRRIESDDPADDDFALPGMESRRVFNERASQAVRDCVAKHAHQTSLIVAHGGILRAFFVAAFGLPWSSGRQIEIPNCAYNSFRSFRGRWRLEAWAESSHFRCRSSP